jgi:hypothetical protein
MIPLRATIEPANAQVTPENPASYQGLLHEVFGLTTATRGLFKPYPEV